MSSHPVHGLVQPQPDCRAALAALTVLSSNKPDGGPQERELALNRGLRVASTSGNIGKVLALLKAGADVDDLREHSLSSPLMLASSDGHLACVQALHEAGADLDKVLHGTTALGLAALHGQTDVVSCLLEAGASQDAAGLELLYRGVNGALGFNLQVLQLLRAYEPTRNVVLGRRLRAVPGCQAFLHVTRRWTSQLHHFQFLPAERVARLLADGADVHTRDDSMGAPTPIVLARALLQTGSTDARAELVVSADPLPWSEGTHELFPPRGRARAVELLLAGHLLAQRYGTALLDVWLAHVMPRAVYM